MSPATRNTNSDWLRLVQLKLKRFELESVLSCDEQVNAHQSHSAEVTKAQGWQSHPYYCAQKAG
ncbi:MAG: hypothetical protein H6672_07625 [Anaerolineaceae bacterium]|nr:hypothetical protein [Anaerolineaceae bacterium]